MNEHVLIKYAGAVLSCKPNPDDMKKALKTQGYQKTAVRVGGWPGNPACDRFVHSTTGELAVNIPVGFLEGEVLYDEKQAIPASRES